jgi:hypothetical protein
MFKITTKWSMVIVLFLILAPPNSIAQGTNSNANVEDYVRFAFADVPDMITIAKCESGFRQFRSDGKVLRGGPSGQYIGIFQIDENIHTARAKKMNMDIHSIDGNVNYARYLYDSSGTNPWKGCISKPTPAPTPTTPGSNSTKDLITNNLNFRQVSPEVLILQKFLNNNGFTIAPSGPGSIGQETTMFGSLTLAAVMRFQCAKQIVCEGDSQTTGYGRVGPRTRTTINNLIQ